MPSGESSLLVVESGTAARLEITLLQTSDHQGELRRRPIDEHRSVDGDRIERRSVRLLVAVRRRCVLAGPNLLPTALIRPGELIATRRGNRFRACCSLAYRSRRAPPWRCPRLRCTAIRLPCGARPASKNYSNPSEHESCRPLPESVPLRSPTGCSGLLPSRRWRSWPIEGPTAGSTLAPCCCYSPHRPTAKLTFNRNSG